MILHLNNYRDNLGDKYEKRKGRNTYPLPNYTCRAWGSSIDGRIRKMGGKPSPPVSQNYSKFFIYTHLMYAQL